MSFISNLSASACALLVCASLADPEAPPKLVKGVVLNAADRAPLHEYTIVIETAPGPASNPVRPQLERPATGANGRFSTALPFPVRDLDVTLVDWDATGFTAEIGGVPLSPFESQRSPKGFGGVLTEEGYFKARVPYKGEPLELLVPCGPTFEISFKPFEIVVNGPALAASVARLIAVTEGRVDEGVAMTTRVRTVDPMRGWVRFAALPAKHFEKPHRVMLEIVAVDGRWKAVRDVTEALAKGTRAVELEWQACSRWSGMLTGVRTTALAPNWVSAERMSDDGLVRERRRIRVESDGKFRINGLEPGKWRVTTRPLRAQPYTSAVREIGYENPVTEPIQLERIESKSALSGVVRAGIHVEGAPGPSALRIVLRRANEDLPLEEIQPTFAVDAGRYVASFAFAELPEGEFDVEIAAFDGSKLEQYEKTILRGRSGGPALEFVSR